MAKKTTAGKRSSRRKKSAEPIEDAEVVDSNSSTAEQQPDAAGETDQTEALDAANTDDGDATQANPAEDTGEAAPESSDNAADASSEADSAPETASTEQNSDVESVEETAGATEIDADAQGSDEVPSEEADPVADTDSDEASADENGISDDVAAEGEATDPDDLEDKAASVPDDGVSDDSEGAAEMANEPAAMVAPAPAPEPRKASAVPMIFGGLLAGAIGFGAAYVMDGVNPPPVPEPVDLSGIEQSIEAQGQRLEEVAASISEVDAPTVDTSDLEASIASVLDSVTALDARITALENRPAGDSADGNVSETVDPALLEDLNALKATVEELDALRSTVAALENANEAAKEAASSEAAAALQRAAMTRVQTALDTGAPFADAVGELQTLGLEVPAPLSDSAADGVPTLSSLQDAFPEAARAALAADRADSAANGNTEGVVDFFRSQLGARSLTPQEGDSSDAVLSRVEHALREGRLTDALAEIETLPAVSQPAMADWSTIVAIRADALSAAQALMDSLN